MASTTTNQSVGGSDTSVQTAGERRSTTTETQPTRVTRTQEPQQVTRNVQEASKTVQQQLEYVGCTISFTIEIETTPPPKALA